MKNKAVRITLMVLIILAIVIGAYFIAKGNPFKDATKALEKSSDPRFPLKKGDRGDLVRQLQQALNKKGLAISVDGVFGDQTVGALKTATGKDTVSESEFKKLTT